MEPIFTGTRTEDGVIVTFKGRILPTRLDWRNHSPDGFEWGYGGSGPAQLALAMLGALFPKPIALKWYQDFKFEWVAGFAHEGWQLDAETVRTWLCQRELYRVRKP